MSQRTRTDRHGRSVLVATVTTAEQPRSESTLASRSGSDSAGMPDVLSFPDVDELYRTFTPKALELLEAIRRERPASISETARLVGRDVKNVHTELHRLDDVGVVSFVDEGRATRPVTEYDEVRLRVSFDERSPAPSGSNDGREPPEVPEIPEAVYGRITDAVLALDPAARVTY
ncbi:MAG: hypothetical protein M8354_08005, partial [Halalkalicoccus sp.]|nr:hypothetical protein [Halalkalicoccus sp.]